MKEIRRLSSVIILTVFILGCARREESIQGAIPQEKFVQVYVDLLMAGETGLLSRTDTSYERKPSAVVDSILAVHGVTEAQVRETVREYSKDLRKWKEFYDEVIRRLEGIQE